MPLTAGRAAVAASFAVFVAFTIASQARQPGESAAVSSLFAAAFLPLYWIAAGLAWRASRVGALDARGRRAWQLFAVANALLALNNALFYVQQHGPAFPGLPILIAAVVPLLWYAAMFAALVRLPRAMDSGLERATFWLDATTVFFSGLVIMLYAFAHTPGESSVASPLASLTTIAFPAINGAVLFAALVVILRPAHGVSRAAIGLIAAAVALNVVADLAYGRAAAVGAHRPGIWYEPLYLLAACFAAAAAQVQRERPGRDTPRSFALPALGSSLLPYAAVAGAALVVILEVRGRWDMPLGRMVLAAVMLTALVMARQLISRRHIEVLAAAERARLARQAALESQLQQAQKLEAVGLLAGGIAHDFNNILTAIRASAELAAASGTAARAEMDEIVRAVDHGASLTRQLLAFGRRDAVQVQRFDLRDAVRDIDPMLRRVVTGEIVLRVSLPPEGVAVEMDRGQLEQVLLNLAINARDAMPDGGVLELAVRTKVIDVASTVLREGRYASVTVTDTGHGISPDVIDRIFEPFFTTKPRGRGSGLGLSTVYAIVARAGGTVHVSSAANRGTTFEVLLPAVEDAGQVETQAAAASESPSLPGTSSRQEVVLLVDDEAAIRDVVGRYLTRHGYTVIAAADGPEALAQLSSGRQSVDLLLTDLTMPGMSGRTLIQRARAIDPALRVICMSGYADHEPPSGDGADPVSNHITKPFSLGTLGRLVRSTLDTPAA